MTESMLDNIVWHSLAGTQARLARGTAAARRLAPGFPLLLGFADRRRPDFCGLDAYCAPGERFYCFGWPGPVAPGWQVDAEAAALQMVRDGPPSQRFEPFPCVWLTP